MELVDLPEFGPEEYAQIVDGESDPFGTEDLGIHWRPQQVHVGLMEEGRLIAHAGWSPVEARAPGGELLDAVGLGGVLIHRDSRGRGVGGPLVLGAMDRMREQDRPFGMLFCRAERVPFYGQLGWHPARRRVTADQPDGSVRLPLVTCWIELIEGACLPDTDLHIVGPPF